MSDAPDPQTDKGGDHVPPFWHEGTERPLHRPRDPEEQQEYSRGKTTCQTINTLLVIDATGQLCFLSAPYEGKANAQSRADREG